MGALKNDPQLGQRFGKLEVIEVGLRRDPGPSHVRSGKVGDRAVRVHCDCGTEYVAFVSNLYSTRWPTTMCRACRGRDINATHGMYNHPNFHVWQTVVKQDHGIEVYEPWRDAAVFCSYVDRELGPRPDGKWFSRIDRSKGYEPGNVAWLTQSEMNVKKWDGKVTKRNRRRLMCTTEGTFYRRVKGSLLLERVDVDTEPLTEEERQYVNQMRSQS